MEAVFRVKAEELGLPIQEKIRALYGNKELRLSLVVEDDVEHTPTTKKGVLLKDLPDLLHRARLHSGMSFEDMDDFERDINQYRDWANKQPIRDPWEQV